MGFRFVKTCWIFILLTVLSGAAFAQQFSSGAFKDMDINAGILDFGGEPFRLNRIGENADITLHPANAEDKPLRIRAREITFTYAAEKAATPDTITFTDNVIINHPQVNVTAGKAVWSFEKNIITLTQSPVLTSPDGREVAGEHVELDLGTGRCIITKGVVKNMPIGGTNSSQSQPQTPGLPLLQSNDVRDWSGLLTKIKAEASADGASPGKQVISLLDPKTRKYIEGMPVEELVKDKTSILKELNKVMRRTEFYNENAWGTASLNPEAQGLIAKGPAVLSQPELVRLNRLLFIAAYPDALAPLTSPTVSGE